MAWFKKKPDPISARARALSAEIAALEAQIKRLDGRRQDAPAPVRAPSQAAPRVVAAPRNPVAAPVSPPVHEPVFEPVDQDRLKPGAEAASTPEHYNELGMRKYDLPALMRRVRDQFRGPSTTNPKLVSYLAAGGIQGLRPMRYEKRVARNRFIALAIILFLMLLGIIAVLRH